MTTNFQQPGAPTSNDTPYILCEDLFKIYKQEDLEVVGSCGDGTSAWSEAQRLRPDVIVSDIEMPGMTGLELAMKVQEHALPSKLVIVTTFARPGYLRRALDAGVVGYLLKDSPADELAAAVRKVMYRVTFNTDTCVWNG